MPITFTATERKRIRQSGWTDREIAWFEANLGSRTMPAPSGPAPATNSQLCYATGNVYAFANEHTPQSAEESPMVPTFNEYSADPGEILDLSHHRDAILTANQTACTCGNASRPTGQHVGAVVAAPSWVFNRVGDLDDLPLMPLDTEVLDIAR